MSGLRRILLAALSVGILILSNGCGSGDSGDTPAATSAGERALTREAADPLPPAGTGYVYRFAKKSNGAYFYTGNLAERDFVIANFPDFRYEGIAFLQQIIGASTQVYRFANLNNGGYFYTANAGERDYVMQTRPDLRFEGTSFSVALPSTVGSIPVYRLANLKNGAYLYTAQAAERDFALGLGNWRSEGVAFSSPSASVANAAPVANAGAGQNVTTGTAVTLIGSASSDANGDTLTYAWTLVSKPAGSAAVLAGATSATPTFTADRAGIYVASLIVNDGKVTSASSNVSVTATAPSPTTSVTLYLFSNEPSPVYLGCFNCNPFDSESICNQFGTYGGEFASRSIWNEFGTYGGQFSTYSPWNSFSSSGPSLVGSDNRSYGYFTTNSFKGNRTSNQSALNILNYYSSTRNLSATRAYACGN